MPVDRGAIDAQLRALGESERWWDQQEFRDLPHVLHPGEQLRGLVNGKLAGPRRPRLRPAARWLVAATDQRIIFLKHERFARKQIEIDNGEIIRVHQGSRLRAYQIVIETPMRIYRLRIGKVDAFRFARALDPVAPQPQQQAQDHAHGVRSRIPGLGRLAALPPGAGGHGPKGSRAPESVSPEQVRYLETTVERLQEDVERLQQQVAFLENLLHRQAEESVRAQMPAPS
jgi:hypothetical protein